MAVYAVGDIQGCHESFLRLLERLRFDPAADRLWLVGDLVNRGPDSVGVLRTVQALGDRAVTVLGNHDLHTLAVWRGYSRAKRNDTINQILRAEDGEALLDWLRRHPLIHCEPELGFAMVHAGLPPAWSFAEACERAREAEAACGGDEATFDALMGHIYGDEPRHWSPGLAGWERLRYIINALTRMRFCGEDGRLLFEFKGPPEEAPPGHLPWYEARRRLRGEPDPYTLVVGHWSTLGYREPPGALTLDTGCLWGGSITAVRLDGERERVSLPCGGAVSPP